MPNCPVVVQKYGGSSVADVPRLRRVAERVVATREAGKRVCVVVSAMGKTTDELLALAGQVSPAPPRRELDMLLTCGERISMSLLSMAIADLGHQAISFTGSQAGIMTNDRHSGARIIEVRPIRVQDELERGRIVIVGGFQGVSYKREITTLGRGGSDTTAVALAAALGAEYCEICSDVDGVYSGDPRVVEAPALLSAISYDAMQELAEHGARVLNPQAVEFARRAGIAVFARATDRGPADGGGTRIGPALAEQRGALAVAGMTGLVRLRLADAAAADDVLAALAADGIGLLRFVAGVGADAVFSRQDVPDWPRVRERLRNAFGDALAVEEELGSVTVVGEGIGGDPATLQAAVQTARQVGARLRGHDAAPLRVTLFVDPGHVTGLQGALHRVFIEGA